MTLTEKLDKLGLLNEFKRTHDLASVDEVWADALRVYGDHAVDEFKRQGADPRKPWGRCQETFDGDYLLQTYDENDLSAEMACFLTARMG